MSTASDQPTESIPLEALFKQAMPLLTSVVRAAFRSCNRPLILDDIERCCDRLLMKLWDKGEYKPLRDFRQESKLRAYLLPIAHHEVIHFLREKGKSVPLDELPQSMIEQPPQQYESVLRDERLHKLAETLLTLTEHEQRLFAMMREGMKAAEIARKLGITKGTAYLEMSTLGRS